MRYTIILLVCIYPVFLQGENIHPRLLFDEPDVELLRERIKNKQEPYYVMYETLYENVHTHTMPRNEKDDDVRMSEIYSTTRMAVQYAFVGMVEKDTALAIEAYKVFDHIRRDTAGLVWDLRSFGLTRAQVLQSASYVYDFCYPLLSEEQRQVLNRFIFDLMVSVHASMGLEGNYATESNWQGVRYGSVLMAAIAYDDVETERHHLPFKWDSRRRLQDHLHATFTKNGWNVESLGYLEYNFSFSIPALIAQQRVHPGLDAFDLEEFVPDALNAFRTHATANVNIPSMNKNLVKADFSDDHSRSGYVLYPLALKVMEEEQLPYLYWMHDYVIQKGVFSGEHPYLIYGLMFYEENMQKKNPEEAGWLNYVCDEHGVLFMRNRFRDENDIVAAMSVTAQRKDGHKGPDNLSFRIYGLNGLWAVGGGRTNEMAAQTNLFPDVDIDTVIGQNVEGTLIDYHFESDGSGYIVGEGSCAGVIRHRRYFGASYAEVSGAEAVFVVSDISENGRIWRLSTPEFNEVEVLEDGFLIKGPKGASLRARVMSSDGKDFKHQISVGKARYGGSVIRHNTGVCFYDTCYKHVKTIDVLCDGDITVVMTLIKEGEEHPVIKYISHNKIQVGELIFSFLL